MRPIFGLQLRFGWQHPARQLPCDSSSRRAFKLQGWMRWTLRHRACLKTSAWGLHGRLQASFKRGPSFYSPYTQFIKPLYICIYIYTCITNTYLHQCMHASIHPPTHPPIHPPIHTHTRQSLYGPSMTCGTLAPDPAPPGLC